MVIDKNYFLSRLQAGEKIEDIGNEFAAMMNAAVQEQMAAEEAARQAELAKQAEVEKEAAKRELIAEMVDIVKELAILEGMDESDLDVTEEDMDQMVDAFTEMFAAMRDLKKLFASIEANEAGAGNVPASIHCAPVKRGPVARSDEEILHDFLKMFN